MRKIILVSAIIACAVGGTAGVLELYKRYVPGATDEDGDFVESKIARKLHEEANRKSHKYES